MAISLNKTIARDSDNIINTDTNYSELNTKASNLVEDIVTHMETQLVTIEDELEVLEGENESAIDSQIDRIDATIATTSSVVDTQVNRVDTAVNAVDTKIGELLSVGDSGYTKDFIDNKLEAIDPFSGYRDYDEVENNFVFKEDANFLSSIADKNRFLNFKGTIVDTHSEELSNINSIVFSGVVGERVEDSVPELEIGKAFSFTVYKKGEGTLRAYFGRYSNDEAYIETTHVGLKSFIVIPTSISDGEITYRDLNGDGFTLDNISVNKIQTYDGTQHEPNVIVQDQQVNGLNLTQSVSKGEMVVVDRDELVTNGTFTNSSRLTSYVYNNGDSTLTLTDDVSTDTGYVNIDIPVKIGVSFVATIESDTSFTPQSGYNNNIKNVDGTGQIDFGGDGILGKYYAKIIPTTSSVRLTVYVNDTTATYNISVKQVDETFRATRDTADMYDVSLSNSGLVNGSFNGAYIVFATENGSNANPAISQHFYKRVDGGLVSSAVNLANTAFGNPSVWKDLGTSTNQSLYNPYFENNDHRPLTNPILVAHTMTESTRAYNGLEGEVLFKDPLAVETTKGMMTKNGFSVVDEGMYSKDGKWYIVCGYYTPLNKGAYHPFYNPMGTNFYQDTTISTNSVGWWYGMPTGVTNPDSAYHSFFYASIRPSYDGTLGTNPARPDAKFYNAIYTDQFIDKREYSFRPDKLTLDRIKADKEANGVSSMVGMVSTTHNRTIGVANTSCLIVNPITESEYSFVEAINKFGSTTILGTSDGYIEITSITGSSGYAVFNFTSTVMPDYFIITKQIPINSSATKLSIDLIGSPDNYPQVLKDRLAEGKTVFGLNPLLVGQDGTDYTDNSAVVARIYKDKVLDIVSPIRWAGSAYIVESSFVSNLNTDNNSDSVRNFSADNFFLIGYTSSNPSYQQSDPLPIVEVEPKVIATNSHSIYKGANIGNSNGYIQVGDGTNGLESRVLENADYLEADKILPSSGVISVAVGEKVVYMGGSAGGDIGCVYTRASTNVVGSDLANLNFSGSAWIKLSTTPQHPSLSLDNSTAVANKFFKALAKNDRELVSQVVIERVTYDGVGEWGDGEFTQLTNGTIPDVNGGDDVPTFVGRINLGVKV